jgi:hypothetical protein
MDNLQGIEHTGHFNAAWENRDAAKILKEARELKRCGRDLSLNAAMRVVILLSYEDHPLFKESAEHWLDRVRAEREPVVGNIAEAALEGLQGPLERKCEIVLRRLMCGEFPPGHRLDDMDPPAGRARNGDGPAS